MGQFQSKVTQCESATLASEPKYCKKKNKCCHVTCVIADRCDDIVWTACSGAANPKTGETYPVPERIYAGTQFLTSGIPHIKGSVLCSDVASFGPDWLKLSEGYEPCCADGSCDIAPVTPE